MNDLLLTAPTYQRLRCPLGSFRTQYSGALSARCLNYTPNLSSHASRFSACLLHLGKNTPVKGVSTCWLVSQPHPTFHSLLGWEMQELQWSRGTLGCKPTLWSSLSTAILSSQGEYEEANNFSFTGKNQSTCFLLQLVTLPVSPLGTYFTEFSEMSLFPGPLSGCAAPCLPFLYRPRPSLKLHV